MPALQRRRRSLGKLQQRRVAACRGGRLPPQRARQAAQLLGADAPAGLKPLQLGRVLLLIGSAKFSVYGVHLVTFEYK